MQRLRAAGLEVFAERGYHAARVDDIVRVAETSHGTFYLYFANKEELLRALATECAGELRAAAQILEPATTEPRKDDDGAVLLAFVAAFMATYARYGPVIRAWMEDQMGDGEVNRLGVRTFTAIADALARRLEAAGVPATPAHLSALMALLERVAYYLASGRLDADDPAVVPTITAVVRRGFFTIA